MTDESFRPIRIEWVSYYQWRQVGAAATPPGATVPRDSKPPATNSEERRMCWLSWALYVLCSGLAVWLAYAWVAW